MLNQKIFDTDIEQVPIRKGFGEGLLLSAEKDSRVVGLCADLTDSTQMSLFKEKYPTSFIELGVAEQNLASVGSGMAAMGHIPFITSYAMFSPGRNWEQIRTTICYNDRKVIIAGSHAGMSVGPDGGSHQAIEDIAITRVIPNLIVISPCDAIEAKKATLAVISDTVKSPVYIRLAREKTPVITTEDAPFEIGKAQIVYRADTEKIKAIQENQGSAPCMEVALIATGALVYQAIKVAHELEGKGIGALVVNLSTIKPLDTATITAVAKEAGAVVTIEEHQIAGGMGSAVAECLVQQFPVPIEFIGVHDQFGQSGTPTELIEHYGMGEKDIMTAALKVIARKNKN